MLKGTSFNDLSVHGFILFGSIDFGLHSFMYSFIFKIYFLRHSLESNPVVTVRKQFITWTGHLI